MMVLSSLLSAIFAVAGLWLSYALNLTSGASIILVAGLGFLVSFGLERLLSNLPARSVE
jgi:zinc transport system permease protein